MDMEVNFERERRKNRINQCYNCQKFGHSVTNCHVEAVCRHCAGPHESRQHPKEDVPEPSKCANCDGQHESNCRGCPRFPSKEKTGNHEYRRHPQPQRPTRTREALPQPGRGSLEELLLAMDELRDLVIKRPILANMISLKNIAELEAEAEEAFTRIKEAASRPMI
ncbi:hypothetical protein JTB14_018771 [Gonioctena quinquepunctata]|nr:hypothetical protein JTB14_018771 [Gonioctena quinquepunctata]